MTLFVTAIIFIVIIIIIIIIKPTDSNTARHCIVLYCIALRASSIRPGNGTAVRLWRRVSYTLSQSAPQCASSSPPSRESAHCQRVASTHRVGELELRNPLRDEIHVLQCLPRLHDPHNRRVGLYRLLGLCRVNISHIDTIIARSCETFSIVSSIS